MNVQSRLRSLETALDAEAAPPLAKRSIDYDAVERELEKIEVERFEGEGGANVER